VHSKAADTNHHMHILEQESSVRQPVLGRLHSMFNCEGHFGGHCGADGTCAPSLGSERSTGCLDCQVTVVVHCKGCYAVQLGSACVTGQSLLLQAPVAH